MSKHASCSVLDSLPQVKTGFIKMNAPIVDANVDTTQMTLINAINSFWYKFEPGMHSSFCYNYLRRAIDFYLFILILI